MLFDGELFRIGEVDAVAGRPRKAMSEVTDLGAVRLGIGPGGQQQEGLLDRARLRFIFCLNGGDIVEIDVAGPFAVLEDEEPAALRGLAIAFCFGSILLNILLLLGDSHHDAGDGVLVVAAMHSDFDVGEFFLEIEAEALRRFRRGIARFNPHIERVFALDPEGAMHRFGNIRQAIDARAIVGHLPFDNRQAVLKQGHADDFAFNILLRRSFVGSGETNQANSEGQNKPETRHGSLPCIDFVVGVEI